MHTPIPLTRDLVLIGGGHSHALVLRMWGMKPLPGVRLTVINPGPTAPYSGMLPGHVAGHYDKNDLEIDLVKLARFAGARIVVGSVHEIDRQARQVRIPGHPDIRYDIASIDVGIHTEMPALPGFGEHGVPAKPLDRFAEAWDSWATAAAARNLAPEATVIGAGIAGVELALAMHHRLHSSGITPRLALVDSGDALAGISTKTRAALLTRLKQANIALHERVRVSQVTGNSVCLDDGQVLGSGFTVGVAGARPHGWLSDLGLDTHNGYIVVDEHLRSVTDPAVFACGDCAHLGFAPRPKAGVFAVRAAPILFANLRAALAGTRPRRFRPQKDYLKLVSLGGKDAVADKNGITFSGSWLWRWKDHIDRSFMDKFHHLPVMKPAPLPAIRADGVDIVVGDAPLCGGCGAKVAGARLKSALATLPAPERSDVLSLPGDDAAVLDMQGARQVLTTDHLRAFTEDPALLARIAAVHALGDIWAMGAKPQAALASITLPRMRNEMQEATLREILDTAAEVFRTEGADIVGGHTSVGAELTVGFTLTGLPAAEPITLAGAQPGDALVLTKPVGSGTVLAGEMQGKANGRDVLAALTSMARPQGDAAKILSRAHAMTDVTGFGLAGHLMGICEASGVVAEITLEDVSLYDGAEALAASGIRSTLYPSNRDVAARMVLPDDPRADLLFDPQTAGGLLAAVPASECADVLSRLQRADYPAARIGQIVEGAPFIVVM